MVTYVRLHELYTGLYHNVTVYIYIYYMYKTKFYTPDGATNSARPVITLADLRCFAQPDAYAYACLNGTSGGLMGDMAT